MCDAVACLKVQVLQQQNIGRDESATIQQATGMLDDWYRAMAAM